jgi:hypothetical protein
MKTLQTNAKCVCPRLAVAAYFVVIVGVILVRIASLFTARRNVAPAFRTYRCFSDLFSHPRSPVVRDLASLIHALGSPSARHHLSALNVAEIAPAVNVG